MSNLSTSSSWLTHKISTFIPHTNFWHTFFLLFVLAHSLPDWICCGGGAAGGPGRSSQLFLMVHKPKGPSDNKYSLSGWRGGVNNSQSSSLIRGELCQHSGNMSVSPDTGAGSQMVGRSDERKKRNAQRTQGGWSQMSEVVQQVTIKLIREPSKTWVASDV